MDARIFLKLIKDAQERAGGDENVDLYSFAADVVDAQKEADAAVLEAAGMKEAADIVRAR